MQHLYFVEGNLYREVRLIMQETRCVFGWQSKSRVQLWLNSRLHREVVNWREHSEVLFYLYEIHAFLLLNWEQFQELDHLFSSALVENLFLGVKQAELELGAAIQLIEVEVLVLDVYILIVLLFIVDKERFTGNVEIDGFPWNFIFYGHITVPLSWIWAAQL